MHVLHTWCNLNPQPPLWTWWDDPCNASGDLPASEQAMLSLPRSQREFIAGGVEVCFDLKQSAPLT